MHYASYNNDNDDGAIDNDNNDDLGRKKLAALLELVYYLSTKRERERKRKRAIDEQTFRRKRFSLSQAKQLSCAFLQAILALVSVLVSYGPCIPETT